MKPKILIYIIMVLAMAPGAYGAKRRSAPKPKFTTEELTARAEQAFMDYDVETAREKLAALRADKNANPAYVEELGRKVNRLDEMIQRVQDIAVIDSINVGRAEFFRHYRLSAAAGRLVGPEELGPATAKSTETAGYIPEDGSLMIWGTDKGLAESRRLTDGSWDTPVYLGDDINAGGIANYPFMLSDGATLYFATEGDDSLGGLDLYIARRQRDGFSLPQNMGMPYNSPFDDFMLAIDEDTGAGWFASDRNQMDDSVTIYVFIPAETRINIDIDDPELVSRAKISKLSADSSGVLKRIEKIDGSGSFGDYDSTPDFEFALPDGRILTRWDQFRKPAARRLMETYVDALSDFDVDETALEELRRKYKPGNPEASKRIIALEKKVDSARRSLKKLANQVIQAELAK